MEEQLFITMDTQQPIALKNDDNFFFRVLSQGTQGYYWFDLCYINEGFDPEKSLANATICLYCSFVYGRRELVFSLPENTVFKKLGLDRRLYAEQLLRYSAYLIQKMGLKPKDVKLLMLDEIKDRLKLYVSPSMKRFSNK